MSYDANGAPVDRVAVRAPCASYRGGPYSPLMRDYQCAGCGCGKLVHPSDQPKGGAALALPEQPMPPRNDRPAVWDLVISDMGQRDYTGFRRYGTRLQPHNGRDALRDAYEEAMDLAVYLRQAIWERDGK